MPWTWCLWTSFFWNTIQTVEFTTITNSTFQIAIEWGLKKNWIYLWQISGDIYWPRVCFRIIYSVDDDNVNSGSTNHESYLKRRKSWILTVFGDRTNKLETRHTKTLRLTNAFAKLFVYLLSFPPQFRQAIDGRCGATQKSNETYWTNVVHLSVNIVWFPTLTIDRFSHRY